MRFWTHIFLFFFTACSATPTSLSKPAFLQLGSLSVVSGNEQSAAVETTLSQRFVVKVLDKSGKPMIGQKIKWVSSLGTLDISSSISDESGTSQGPLLTLGSKPGPVLITATAENDSSQVSADFTANALVGAAASLVFSQQPAASISQYATMTLAPQVSILDANGNLETNSSAVVSLNLNSAMSGVTFSGTTTMAAVSGVASFGNLMVDTIGTDYTLTANVQGLNAVTSSPFSIADAGLTMMVQPRGSDFQTAVCGTVVTLSVLVTDAKANPVTGAQVNWQSSSTLNTKTSLTDIKGIASVQVTLAGTTGPNTVTATLAKSAKQVSKTFQIDGLPGPVNALLFSQQPSNTKELQPMTITVSIRDAQGNVDITAQDSVALKFASNPSNANLSGMVTAAASAGIVTFSGLAIDKVGSNYSLEASDGSMNVISNPFSILDAGLTISLFSQSQSQAVVGSTVAQPFAAIVRDAAQNPVASAPVTWAAINNDGSLGVTQNAFTNAAGIVQSPDLLIANNGPNQMQVSLTNHPSQKVVFAINGASPVQQMITRVVPTGYIAASLSSGKTQSTINLAQYVGSSLLLDTNFGSNSSGKITFTSTQLGSLGDLIYYPQNGAVGPYIYIVGSSFADDGSIYLARLSAAGSLDTSFGNSGYVQLSIPANSGFTGNFTPTKLAIDSSSHNLLIAGNFMQTSVGSGNNLPFYPSVFALMRVNPATGALDASFGSSGKVLVPATVSLYDPQNLTNVAKGFNTLQLKALTQDSSGGIFLGGSTYFSLMNSSQMFIAKLTSSGQLDTSFAPNSTRKGILQYAVGSASLDQISAMAVQANGKLVVAGSSRSLQNGSYSTSLAMLRIVLASSLLDSFFGNSGFSVLSQSTCPNCAADTIQLVGDTSSADPQSIYLGGYATNASNQQSFAIFRFTGSGTLDSTYNSSGTPGFSLTSTYGSGLVCAGCNLDSLVIVGGKAQGAGCNFDPSVLGQGSTFQIVNGM